MVRWWQRCRRVAGIIASAQYAQPEEGDHESGQGEGGFDHCVDCWRQSLMIENNWIQLEN